MGQHRAGARTARALIADAETGGAVPTVRTFAPAFLADCAGRWKPATRENYAHTVRRFILPAFGDRRVDAVTAKDARNWFVHLDDTTLSQAAERVGVEIERKLRGTG